MSNITCSVQYDKKHAENRLWDEPRRIREETTLSTEEIRKAECLLTFIPM